MRAQSAGSLSQSSRSSNKKKKNTTAGSAVQRDRTRPYHLRFQMHEQENRRRAVNNR